MGFTVAFDLSESDNDIFDLTLQLATVNQFQLHNRSLLTIRTGLDLSTPGQQELIRAFHGGFEYQTREQLDEYLFVQRALVFFRACQSRGAIMPLTTPVCIHAPKNEQHGDIFIDVGTLASKPFDPASTAQALDARVIQPALRIVPTVAYPTGRGLVGVLVGTRPQEQIGLIKMETLNRGRALPPTPLAHNPGLTSVKDEGVRGQATAPCDALAKLKETVGSIRGQQLPSAPLAHNPGLISVKDEGVKGQSPSPWSKARSRVKMMCNWTSSAHLLADWGHMLRGMPAAQEVEWVSEGSVDYWVIINKPPPGEVFDPARTIVFRMEPYIDTLPFYNDWLAAGPPKADFLFFLDHAHFRNNSEWWLGGLEELSRPIVKTALLSTVVSSQYEMEGHRLRVDFVKYFQANSQLPLDVFGHDNKHGFARHQGSLPMRRKDGGVMPYKYHFAAENSDIPNYMTEKFFDALLSECLLFYWGCSNAAEHVDQRAFIRLDLRDQAGSLRTIERAIADDEWSKRLPFIQAEKRRVLALFGPFARVSSLLEAHAQVTFVELAQPGAPPQTIPGITPVRQLGSNQVELSAALLAHYIPTAFKPGDYARLVEHLAVWKQCAQAQRTHCVLEGVAGPNFLDHMTELLAHLRGSHLEWDMIVLRWGGQEGQIVAQRRDDVIVPLMPYLVKQAAPQPNGQRLVTAGQIASGYLISPRGAQKIVSFIERYGFLAPIDDFLLALQNMIPNPSFWLAWKDLVGSAPPVATAEIVHLFRKGSNGQWTNEHRPFSFPPPDSAKGELLVLTESQLRQQIEAQQAK